MNPPNFLTEVVSIPEDADLQKLEEMRSRSFMASGELRKAILHREISGDALCDVASNMTMTIVMNRNYRLYMMEKTRLVVFCKDMEMILNHRLVGPGRMMRIVHDVSRLLASMWMDLDRFIIECKNKKIWWSLVSFYRVVRFVYHLALCRLHQNMTMPDVSTALRAAWVGIHSLGNFSREMRDQMSNVLVADLTLSILKRLVLSLHFATVMELGYPTLAPKSYVEDSDVSHCTRTTREFVKHLCGEWKACKAMAMTPERWDALGVAAAKALREENVEEERLRNNGLCLFAYVHRFSKMCKREDCKSEHCFMALEMAVKDALRLVYDIFRGLPGELSRFPVTVMEVMDESLFTFTCKRISAVNLEVFMKMAKRLKRPEPGVNVFRLMRNFSLVAVKYFAMSANRARMEEELPEKFRESLLMSLCYFLEDYLLQFTNVLNDQLFIHSDDYTKEKERYHGVLLPDVYYVLDRLE